MNPPKHTTGRGGPIEHRDYLIDHFRVSFLGGAAWKCPCREFLSANTCRHTREAAGMRAAQTQILDRVRKGDSGFHQHVARARRPGFVR
jgi:hypothetical protein